jgi:hypothetical protein
MNEYTEFFANALAHSVLLVLSMVYLANGYKIPVCIYVYGFLYHTISFALSSSYIALSGTTKRKPRPQFRKSWQLTVDEHQAVLHACKPRANHMNLSRVKKQNEKRCGIYIYPSL